MDNKGFRIIFAFVCFLATNGYSQYNCNPYGMGERRDDGTGVMTSSLSYTQHPVTTFSYYDDNSIFKRDRDINENLGEFKRSAKSV